MTKPVHPSNEIEFKSTRRYNCPMCGFKTDIQPCVSCLARQSKAALPLPYANPGGSSPRVSDESARTTAIG